MSDLDDYLAYLRYERAAAAQTIATYRRLLLQFAAAFPEENLRALDAQTLKDYLLRLTKEHKYSAATLNQHRAALPAAQPARLLRLVAPPARPR